MNFTIKEYDGDSIAFVTDRQNKIVSCQDALDLMYEVRYWGSDKIAISKENIDETFFDLSTGLAGEILQKFSDYTMKIAVYGDFGVYKSKSLKDFIYECNRGKTVFFTFDSDEAAKMLSK